MAALITYRVVLSLALSGVVGVLGLHAWPFPADNLVLALVHAERPALYAGFEGCTTREGLRPSDPDWPRRIKISTLWSFLPGPRS